MARLGNKNQLRGAIGPVIFQERYGKGFARGRKKKIRQTNATKISSSEFKYCSRWSKYIRIGLQPLWLGNTDSLVSQKLSGVIYAALQRNVSLPKGERNWSNTDIGGIKGFEVNSQSPFERYFKTEIGVVLTPLRTIKISVPESITNQVVLYPNGCSDAELVCCVTATKITDGALVKTISIRFALPSSSTTLSFADFESEVLPPDSVIVVAAQLVFYSRNVVSGRYALNTKTLNPSTLLWAGA